MTIQRMCQPQEAVQPLQNQIKLQPDTPAQRQSNPINGHTPRRMKPTHTRTQECALTRPVTRWVTTQYLHTQNATTRRRCGRNNNQDSPRELSAHRANDIAFTVREG